MLSARGSERGASERPSFAVRAPGVLRYATTPGSPSFTDFLAAAAPDLLPRGTPADAIPHGTTIVAAVYEGGVVMAGDRRSTRATSSRSATSRRCSLPTTTR